MNWSAVRLITAREWIDLLRDRRSVILLVFLPILLYPGFALIGFYFSVSMLEHVSKVGIVGAEHLPPPVLPTGMVGAWWTVLPGNSAVGLSAAEPIRLVTGFFEPALITDQQFSLRFAGSKSERDVLPLVRLPSADRGPLDNRQVDVMLIVPPDFRAKLAAEQQATLELIRREGDESSKIAERRVHRVLTNFDSALRLARFARHGLPGEFDSPVLIHSPQDDQPLAQRSSDELRDRLSHFFPFLLVMWALAGALHPAIDVCAGEKERGTMETLLLSPAERSEIVTGKLLAVSGFSLGTAWWNLIWMCGLAVFGSWFFQVQFLRPSAIVWAAVLTVPLAVLFAACSLALGVFARSTKEGQYYLLPMFLVVIPLVMMSMMPNLELTWRTALIPVTGTCMLLSRLLRPAVEAGTYWYLIPVAISMIVCVVAASAWAVYQFHREEILFREAETRV